MFHDIIAARTEELQAAWNVDQPVEQVIDDNKKGMMVMIIKTNMLFIISFNFNLWYYIVFLL